MRFLALIFTVPALIIGIHASTAAADSVVYNKNFKVVRTPERWLKGSQFCFTRNQLPEECATVTDMGELNLRVDNQTDPDAKGLVAKLSKEDQQILNSYKKFVVRYLSLDGTTEGRYIVQVFFNVGPGAQAIDVYGDFKASSKTSIETTPVGYGEHGTRNLSFLRTDEGDQDAIRISNQIVMLWAENKSVGPALP